MATNIISPTTDEIPASFREDPEAVKLERDALAARLAAVRHELKKMEEVAGFPVLQMVQKALKI